MDIFLHALLFLLRRELQYNSGRGWLVFSKHIPRLIMTAVSVGFSNLDLVPAQCHGSSCSHYSTR